MCLACAAVSCKKSSSDAEPAAQQSEAPPPPITAHADEASPADSLSAPRPTAALVNPPFASTNRYIYKGFHALGTDGPEALIEDIILRRSFFKREGEEVFGFQVRGITREWLTLERDGTLYRLPFSTSAVPALAVPGINASNYPPGFIQTSASTNPVFPGLPPPESQTVQAIRPDQVPANIQTQLQQRLQEKAAKPR